VIGDDSGQMVDRFEVDVIDRHSEMVGVLTGIDDVYPDLVLCGGLAKGDSATTLPTWSPGLSVGLGVPRAACAGFGVVRAGRQGRQQARSERKQGKELLAGPVTMTRAESIKMMQMCGIKEKFGSSYGRWQGNLLLPSRAKFGNGT
jgi:hypothetical protein